MLAISKVPSLAITLALALPLLGAGGCGDSSAQDDPSAGAKEETGRRGRAERSSRGSDGRPSGSGGSPVSATAVPVQVAPVERTSISFYIQSNGTLEAENEVDLIARTSGPIEQLHTEEGRRVAKGQLLAKIEDDEIRAQVEIARVALDEARLNYERAKELYETQLLSPEAYEQTKSRFETAQAQHERSRLQLGYTEIRAPFAGLVVARYVDAAQQVAVGTPLFRLSDFDPLLCPVQVPERELPRLAVGQTAYLTVEAWPNQRFQARVLRLSPVIEARTGTVKVTLDVDGEDKLLPGMFARVFLETETHDAAVVIPKKALSLESLGDTVFVHKNGVAERRDVEIGFEEGDSVEVLAGVSPGEEVVVVGQDGLSDGTPIQVLGSPASRSTANADPSRENAVPGAGRPDPASMTPENLERLREQMRARGLTESEVDERIEQMKQGGRSSGSSSPAQE